MHKHIKFQLPEDEHSLLESYCASVGRTKTDVLREFIRSLPDAEATQELPEGWHWDFGLTKITGEYLDYEVELERNFHGDSYLLYVNNRETRHEIFCDTPVQAINHAQKILLAIHNR